MVIKTYGDQGLLLSELSEMERTEVLAYCENALPNGCSEYVIGYSSVLLVGDLSKLESLPFESMIGGKYAKERVSRLIEIPVHYEGEDLAVVAEMIGATTLEVIELHTSPIYSVRMMGFSPGFPYLDGLDQRLHLKRRDIPRVRVEPGSVAIGGPHAGVYSVASPGGWHVLGHTEYPLFHVEKARCLNASKEAVFALSIGDQVRFKAF